jgi:putative membrane protein
MGQLVPGLAAAHISAAPGLPGAPESDWIAAAAPILLAAVLYTVGAINLYCTHRRRPNRFLARTAAFSAGLVVLAIALLSPLDRLSAELFCAHMVQHELLMLGAAPLLVLGHPLPNFLWAFPRRARQRIAVFLHTRPVRGAWQVVSAAGVAWLLHALALWIWHVPQMFNAALADRTVHDLQHLTFLSAALLFWSALFEARAPQQRAAGIVYLFTTTIHTAVLGALIALASRPWYAEWLQPSAHWRLSALEDQQLGGLIMWVPGCIVYVGCALALFARWVMPDGGDRPMRHAASDDRVEHEVADMR